MLQHAHMFVPPAAGPIAAGAASARTAGLGTASPSSRGTTPATGAARPRAETARSILNTALVAEHLATAFYYTALTTPAILRHPQLGGGSSDPNKPGLPPNGNPHRVRYLQAALDAEAKHADLVAAAGAPSSGVRRFYFPAATFTRLGTSLQADSFLGVLDQIETISIGLYLAAVVQLSQGGQYDLAQLAAELAGVEAEHRMLGRVIADIKPANNLTLEKDPFTDVSQAYAALRPFLTGRGVAGAATRPIALPSRAQVARIVGKYGTRRVSHFL